MSSVYVITNLLNQKSYVGKANNPKKRWRNHVFNSKSEHPRSVIASALKKHGVGNFTFEVVAEFSSEDDALVAEKHWISRLHSNQQSFGYNLDAGGHGGKTLTPETRQKISRALMGRKKSDNHRASMSAAKKNVTTSPDHLAKLIASNVGRPKSLETRRKISVANKGKVRTPEQVEALSKAHMGYKHSDEQKAKISASCKAAAKRRTGTQ
jgi:group I intron endonuclease